jgi:alpha-tubulin suppressor-like RCC1 family protein
VRKLRPVGPRLCAIVALGALVVGCWSGHTAATPPVPDRPTQILTSAIQHWGSFFGGGGGNFDVDTKPTNVILPGVVAQVASSNSTEYALLTDGKLYAWGLGSQGQLGNGKKHNSFTQPVRVRFPAGVKIASIPIDVMPYDTGLAVDTKGQVWGWGHNGGGELCLDNHQQYLRPVQLPLPITNVTTLAGASDHALYDANGTVYACGQNIDGSLGDGSKANSTTPVQVAGLSGANVSLLVASFANSGALLKDGTYYDWGYNGDGQLGDGKIGKASDVPVKVKLPAAVKQVAQGGSYWGNGQTLVLLADGRLYSWGDNWAGQLGLGRRGMEPSPKRFRSPANVVYTELATGSATSYALTIGGNVYAWGASHVGQVGNGGTATVTKPVLVATHATRISSTANNVVVSVLRQCGRQWCSATRTLVHPHSH